MSLTRRRETAFTVIELLVVVGIFILLLSVFVPYLMKVRESDRRVRCADNLNQLRNALQTYAADNGRIFPRVVYDAQNKPNGYIAYSGPDAPDPFAPDSVVQPNDVTASLWLLVREGLIRPERFICPSSTDTPDRISPATTRPLGRSNFRSAHNLSYSYSSPFSAAPGYRMNDTQPSDFAVMADKNPGIVGDNDSITGPSSDAPLLQRAKANSNNHRKAGQNVLYAEGHVSFQKSAYCGFGRDNIYTALARAPLEHSPPPDGNGYWSPDIGPSWYGDSYLVPTDDEGAR